MKVNVQCVCACNQENNTHYVLFISSEKLLDSSLSSSSPLQREALEDFKKLELRCMLLDLECNIMRNTVCIDGMLHPSGHEIN